MYNERGFGTVNHCWRKRISISRPWLIITLGDRYWLFIWFTATGLYRLLCLRIFCKSAVKPSTPNKSPFELLTFTYLHFNPHPPSTNQSFPAPASGPIIHLTHTRAHSAIQRWKLSLLGPQRSKKELIATKRKWKETSTLIVWRIVVLQRPRLIANSARNE